MVTPESAPTVIEPARPVASYVMSIEITGFDAAEKTEISPNGQPIYDM